MEYLKIFTSFEEVIEPLNDAERGRLLTAMLQYADREEVPEFRGNERFVWPTAKQAIDRERARIEQLHANGSKGGRPSKGETKENQRKPNETKENQRKPNETYKEKDKDKEKDNFDDDDMISNSLCACAREALADNYPNSKIPDIWADQLACRAEEYDLDGRMLYESVIQAAEHGAASPVAYAMSVMQDMYEHGDTSRTAYAWRRMHDGHS